MVEDPSPMFPPAEESIEAPGGAHERDAESGDLSSNTASEPDFVCDCDEGMRSACKGLPFYKEHENKRYCVLHSPGKEKAAEFRAALDKKLSDKDLGFRGVWFPEPVIFAGIEFSADADFRYATFSADADFSYATFSADADFSYATFSEAAYFSGATFSAVADFSIATFRAVADFYTATFGGAAYFTGAKLSGDALLYSATFSADADFYFATFSANANFSSNTFSAVANFRFATFSNADFDLSFFHGQTDFGGACFKDSLHFLGSTTVRQLSDGTTLAPMTLGKDPSLDFQHVRVEQSDRIAFHTLTLRPHWFVNVDPRKFVFTGIRWDWEHISIDEEIAALEAKEVSSPKILLAIACRQLAENAEANNRYEEASNFRYWAMDIARLTKWKRWFVWKTDWLHFLYWAVSGYGERILRALGVLVAVLIVFALLYTKVGFEKPLPKRRALTYSLAVMSLQKPDPKPLTGTAQTLVLLETILGPVQAALLALAIRRKFMR